jgi:hypothetical protein
MFFCCKCCVLSGRGLCDELITRPEESYRLWCVVVCNLETSRMRRPWPALDRRTTEKERLTPYIKSNTKICTLYLRFVMVTFKEINSAHKREGYQVWMVAAIVLHYSCGQSTMGGPSPWQLQTGKHTKNTQIYKEMFYRPGGGGLLWAS